MKTLRATTTFALLALLAGCVYEPGYVRHAPYRTYGSDVYVEPGYGSGYYYGPTVGVGIHYDDRHRDKRHRHGWRDRHGHWHD